MSECFGEEVMILSKERQSIQRRAYQESAIVEVGMRLSYLQSNWSLLFQTCGQVQNRGLRVQDGGGLVAEEGPCWTEVQVQVHAQRWTDA